MKYKITHTTTYSYSDPVSICQNQVHLTPRDGTRQSCHYHRLTVHPSPSELGKRVDYFGNHLNYFSINEAHRKLSVTATSRVELHPAQPLDAASTAPWETVRDNLSADVSQPGLEARQFIFQSPYIGCFPELIEYARASFTPARPILQAALDLTARIHGDFKFDSKATTVHTPLEEVLKIRRGVCQDFAHVQIGCLRAIGLPARYVSGYLRTLPPPGKPRLVGADASHAWLAVYCGPLGWIDCDPTTSHLPGAATTAMSVPSRASFSVAARIR
jgi:transglutaminase-like putative cysteine protease